jgi:hypothetical protein
LAISTPSLWKEKIFRRSCSTIRSAETYSHPCHLDKSGPGCWFFRATFFFADILTRRLALDFHAWRNRLLRIWANWRNPTSHDGQTLESLRRTKAAITEKLERRKSTTHFEPTKEEQTAGDMAEPLDNLEAPIKTTPTKPPAAEHSTSPIPEPQESFTSRLLRAKKNVQKDRPPQDPGATSS